VSLLSDRDLLHALGSGDLAVEPFDPALLQPSSLDLRLSPHVLVPAHRGRTVDPAAPPEPLAVTVVGTYLLHPGEFLLASTLETVSLAPTLAARLEGKSTLGRLGLLVHVSAGFIDPGFSGTVTLELKNLSEAPLLLRPGMRIGQLSVFRMSSAPDRPYGSPGLGSHYQGQRGPTPPVPLR
jgi:dCTP deaminase